MNLRPAAPIAAAALAAAALLGACSATGASGTGSAAAAPAGDGRSVAQPDSGSADVALTAAVSGIPSPSTPSSGGVTSSTNTPSDPATGPATTPDGKQKDARAAACDATPWQDDVQGAPAGFDAGDLGGDYLWHGADGFHLRVTHKGDDRAVYAGVITANQPLRMVEPVRLERGDMIWLSLDHRSLYFRFADYGHIDGVDFRTDCATRLAFHHLTVGGDALPASRVFLGAHLTHPARLPVVVRRER